MENAVNIPAEVTPEWLTSVLRRSGFLNRGEVTGVRTILTKTLILSIVSRLEVQYSDNAASLPSQLFLKISRPDLLEPFYSEAYRKEVEFYSAIASQAPNKHFIRCYDAGYSAVPGKSYLLLDDLSETHFQPESPLRPADIYCELAVECLAKLHADWWEHPQLGRQIGTLFDEKQLTVFLDDVERSVVRFVTFLGDRLSAQERRVYDRLIESKYKIWGRLSNSTGLTVTHGDAHWWNFLYPLDTSNDCTRLFDWQLWHVDVGPRDLAFLLALGGYAERKPALEQNLMRRYYDSLIAHGVRNYTWNDCWQDYRWSAIRNLNVPAVQWTQGRSESLWFGNLKRAMLSYHNLECAELLED